MSELLPTHPELLDRDDLKVLVYGSAGRGHALAWKLQQSPIVNEVFIGPGNGGTAENNVPGINNIPSAVRFAVSQAIDLVVVCPDEALRDGAVDQFEARDIAAFGPTRGAAKLEWWKPEAKNRAKDLGIPSPAFKFFVNPAIAHNYIEKRPLPMVVKAAGLAGGKGVKVCRTRTEAHEFTDQLMVERIFDDAGNVILIEDALDPEKNIEFSGHSITDGTITKAFISSQDHKQLYDGDKGPNTGGMGTIAPVEWLAQEKIRELNDIFVQPMIDALRTDEEPFRGIIYPGLMGYNLLEYNARFGDPEAQVYMRLLKTDLAELMVATLNSRLDQIELEWHDGHAICVVAAAKGYPDDYETGLEIHGLEAATAHEGVEIFHAGTEQEDEKFLTNGGRVLNITAVGKTPEEAYDCAYSAISEVRFGDSDENMHYRTDIGQRPAPTNF